MMWLESDLKNAFQKEDTLSYQLKILKGSTTVCCLFNKLKGSFWLKRKDVQLQEELMHKFDKSNFFR